MPKSVTDYTVKINKLGYNLMILIVLIQCKAYLLYTADARAMQYKMQVLWAQSRKCPQSPDELPDNLRISQSL